MRQLLDVFLRLRRLCGRCFDVLQVSAISEKDDGNDRQRDDKGIDADEINQRGDESRRTRAREVSQ